MEQTPQDQSDQGRPKAELSEGQLLLATNIKAIIAKYPDDPNALSDYFGTVLDGSAEGIDTSVNPQEREALFSFLADHQIAELRTTSILQAQQTLQLTEELANRTISSEVMPQAPTQRDVEEVSEKAKEIHRKITDKIPTNSLQNTKSMIRHKQTKVAELEETTRMFVTSTSGNIQTFLGDAHSRLGVEARIVEAKKSLQLGEEDNHDLRRLVRDDTIRDVAKLLKDANDEDKLDEVLNEDIDMPEQTHVKQVVDSLSNIVNTEAITRGANGIYRVAEAIRSAFGTFNGTEDHPRDNEQKARSLNRAAEALSEIIKFHSTTANGVKISIEQAKHVIRDVFKRNNLLA